ncbi:START domain-containing protein [Aeromonas schubertii]|uniref:START domain-containing protein n=1 Tax=Aeromonas schubertii TaxID=652 RepID=A0ABS7V6M5_9GAMM|nr:START domain-containing protein [Aeromonas schubertii]MBZ6065029.1 hypothetical protein [Aeromonas schubertii]
MRSLLMMLWLASAPLWGAQWRLERSVDGVTLWSQPRPPESYLALRLEMRVRAAPAALLRVLRDTSRHRLWLPQSREVRLLARPSPGTDLVYTLLAAPWPAADRELITRSHLSWGEDCRLVLVVQAEPDARPSHPQRVRIRHSSGRWEALPMGDGTTLVRLESYTHPGGSLPAWLVNPMAMRAALEGFSAIRTLMQVAPQEASDCEPCAKARCQRASMGSPSK